MTKLEQAAKMAVNVLEGLGYDPVDLREALAEPVRKCDGLLCNDCGEYKQKYKDLPGLTEKDLCVCEQAEQEPVKSAPFSNCKYQFCDLPGQCIGEGKCHHPNKLTAAPVEPVKQEHSGEANEMVREPVAILKSSKANFERQFGKQVFADWIYYDLTYSFENAAPVQQAEQEPVAWMCSDQRLIDMGYLKFSSVCQGVWNIPLYTRPVRTKYLTDDEIGSLVDAWIYSPDGYEELARAAIAADRELNK